MCDLSGARPEPGWRLIEIPPDHPLASLAADRSSMAAERSSNECPRPAGLDIELLFQGVESAWRRTGDPVLAWATIETCIEKRWPFPAWVCHYLGNCAEKVLQADQSGKPIDTREVLPGVFGFRNPQGSFHRRVRNFQREQFAMVFAEHVFSGLKPDKARSEAAQQIARTKSDDHIDDRTLQRWLKEYFGYDRAPKMNEGFQRLLAGWLLQNWPLAIALREKHPGLPDLLRASVIASG